LPDDQAPGGQDQFGGPLVDFDGPTPPFGHDRTVPTGGPFGVAIRVFCHNRKLPMTWAKERMPPPGDSLGR
jgi:hypothetical protein